MTPSALRCALRWLLFAAGLAGAAIGLSRGAFRAAQATSSRPGRITLSIIGTNDLHGSLLPKDGRGGLETFAGYVRNLRRARMLDDGGVVLIDAGDMFQGTLESNLDEGTSLISAYNVLGYAAAAIGNHDFDFGPTGPLATPATPADDPRGALKARAVEARFPLLAANLIETATGQPVRWPNVKPSTVVEAAGVRVGIIGVMTKNALRATARLNVGGLQVASLSGTVARESTALRASGVSVVIVAAHAGGRCARFDEPNNLASCDVESSEVVDLARSLSLGLVDVIVAGHTHAGMAHVVNGISVGEAFSGGRAFSRVDLTVDRTTKRVVASRNFPPRDICAEVVRGTARCDPSVAGRRSLVTASYEGAPVVGDAAIAALLAPAIDRVRALKATPLGATLDTPIRRDGAVESPLGNLFADALRESTGADVSINNTDGGLRADLPSGPVTYGRLYEVFPFDNEIVRLTMTGRQLRRVVTGQLGRRAPIGISGVQVTTECLAGSLTVTMRRPSGRLVHDQERLLVVTTDYLATGGDGVFAPVMPPNGYDVDDVEPMARDVVAAWFGRRGGHLREDQFVNPTSRRWVYPGALPVRCGRS